MAESQEQLIQSLREQLAEARRQAVEAQNLAAEETAKREGAEELARAKEQELARMGRAFSEKKKELAKKKRELAKKEQELREEKAASQSYAIALTGMCGSCVEVLQAFADQIPDFPECREDQIAWLMKRVNVDAADVARFIRSKLLSYLCRTGTEDFRKLVSDVREVKKALSAIKQTVHKEDVSIKGNQKEMDATGDAISLAIEEVKNLPELADNEVFKAALDIESIPVPEKEQKSAENRKPIGRQRLAGKSDGSIPVFALGGSVCPVCGSADIKRLSDIQSTMRKLNAQVDELIGEATYIRPVCFCNSCNQVRISDDGKTPFPYSSAPGVQVDVELVAGMAMAEAGGMAFNRLETIFGADRIKQLGTETLSRAARALASEGGMVSLLNQAIQKAIKGEVTAVLCDETPIQVTDKKGKSYMLAVSSVPGADRQFVFFSRLDSRSAEAIKQALDGWPIKALVSDGYPAYDTINACLKEAERFIHQGCLVHSRRPIFECLDHPEIRKLLKNRKLMAEKMRNLGAEAPSLTLMFVAKAISKIYAIERSLKRREDETREQQLERIRTTRAGRTTELMDRIDTLMKALATGYAVRRGGDGPWEKKINSPFATPVVYYMNAREKLRAFLTCPEVSPDTNLVEQSIRPIALYKHSAFFKRNNNGLDCFCVYSSLRATAIRSGISNPTEWLSKFCRAFILHCWEYDLTVRYNNYGRKDGAFPTAVHSFSKDAVDDFVDNEIDKWLPWNYVEKLPESERCEPER